MVAEDTGELAQIARPFLTLDYFHPQNTWGSWQIDLIGSNLWTICSSQSWSFARMEHDSSYSIISNLLIGNNTASGYSMMPFRGSNMQITSCSLNSRSSILPIVRVQLHNSNASHTHPHSVRLLKPHLLCSTNAVVQPCTDWQKIQNIYQSFKRTTLQWCFIHFYY